MQSISSTKINTDAAANSGSPPKLHSFLSIFIAVAIGGAIAAGLLVYQNYISLNRREDAKRSISLFLAIGVIALFTAWHTPPDVLSFMLSVGTPQIIVTLLAARSLQKSAIATHRAEGGKFRSLGFALLVAVIANLIIKAVFYGISLATAS